jgi:hypothetical protein
MGFSVSQTCRRRRHGLAYVCGAFWAAVGDTVYIKGFGEELPYVSLPPCKLCLRFNTHLYNQHMGFVQVRTADRLWLVFMQNLCILSRSFLFALRGFGGFQAGFGHSLAKSRT